LRAANLFRSAEFFLNQDDLRHIELLDLFEVCSWDYLRTVWTPGCSGPRALRNGSPMDAYFLRAPYVFDRIPRRSASGGSVFKDELLHEITRRASACGLSLLLVDLPGQSGMR